jgi:hypothetical protein
MNTLLIATAGAFVGVGILKVIEWVINRKKVDRNEHIRAELLEQIRQLREKLDLMQYEVELWDVNPDD